MTKLSLPSPARITLRNADHDPVTGETDYMETVSFATDPMVADEELVAQLQPWASRSRLWRF